MIVVLEKNIHRGQRKYEGVGKNYKSKYYMSVIGETILVIGENMSRVGKKIAGVGENYK